MLKRQMKSVRLEGNDTTHKREELRAYFHQSYDLFESLFDLLKSDDVYYLQSEPTRHPMIFYFGHTAIFYINKLVASGALKERINPHFEELFAVGVDEMTWDASSDSLKWPSIDEVRTYRQKVRHLVDEMIATLPMKLPITKEDPLWAIWMGIEHERIHIETSSVLHRQMPLEFVLPHADFPICPIHGDTPENALVSFTASKVILGKGSEDQGLYGWDNEYGNAVESVEEFHVSKYLVSNGEFMDFVMANGYGVDRWWDEEGLRYLQIRNATCPPFWVLQVDGSYKYRSLTHEIDMPYNWPVEVNALEAEAFCRWKSAQDGQTYRLPTEAEHRAMVQEGGMDEEVFDDSRANINLVHYASSVPVDTFAHGKLYDVVGNVWQWTQTQMDGFEGFITHPWYDDFSEPTFDGRHNLIKGGSWISTGNEILRESRYAFRRHFIQHAGFRYVISEGECESEKNERIERMFSVWKKRYG
ncbi:MAG: 5-histidylcysteine sulfoxide synthase [Sulfuricurvum sp.]|uniref:5-histidylcysteine sulfoxide synthase n=1 Tax=Sulfuricurvum sp. TaxID=2025608 RepID=UPI0025DB2CD0|nr:5-histidylcysteine sulfoxide synthase [Sulfuricurvum sp.]MBV5320868.1 5-histidylcysteine sulfoxide synthase [Sulfuricurvum sp.]